MLRPLADGIDVKTPAAPDELAGNTASPTSDATLFAAHASRPFSAARTGSVFANRALRVDHDRLYIDTGDPSRIWARGKDWKGSFDAQSVAFIPFFGSSAPHNFPVAFTLASVRTGGVELPVETHGAPTLHGERVSIERGAVEERYDLSRDSVEQSFVIRGALASGELSLRLNVETELAASEQDGGIEWKNALGAVRYGRATVVDAMGTKLDLSVGLIENGLEIDVPASFMARAVSPITIDPVISTFDVDVSALRDENADVSGDLTTNRWAVIVQEQYSVIDYDCLAFILDANGNDTGLGTYIDYTSDSWRASRIANNRIASQFLVVGQVEPQNTTNYSIIKGRTMSAATGAMGAQFTISGAEQGNKAIPDVGGDPGLVGPTYYCVTWTRIFATTDYDIHAQMVTTASTLQGSLISIDNSSASLDAYSRISKSDGVEPVTSQSWNIVWERDAAGLASVRGARVSPTGVVITPSFVIESGLGPHPYPCVSSITDEIGGVRRWMVAYYQGETPNALDILGKLYEGSTLLDSKDLTSIDGSVASQLHVEPSLDCDGTQFAMAFLESTTLNPNTFDLYVSTFNAAGGVIGVSEGHHAVTNSADIFDYPEVACMHSSGAASTRAFISYAEIGQDIDVEGALYDTPANAPMQGFCSGDGSVTSCPCGNFGGQGAGCANSVSSSGALLTGSGSARVTNDSLALTASGMPGSAPVLFFQGTSAVDDGAVFGDGLRCVAGQVVRLGHETASLGAAQFPIGSDPAIHVKGQVPAGGGTRFYQAWYRNADPSFCTPSTFNLTNGFRVTWLP